MSDEQFEALMRSQRDINRTITMIGYMVALVFVFDVVAPVLQHIGWWNLLGW